jgi:hypothetical protein
MNPDNFAGSGNWTAERRDAGPSASEGERQGRREHKHGCKKSCSDVSYFICVHPCLSAVSDFLT